MKFRCCFCLKRNRASYNVSSKTTYTNSNSITSTVTVPPLPSSGDGQFNNSNEYLVPTTIKCNDYMNITQRRLSQPLYENDKELYATVDKTKQAKNTIRIRANTDYASSITTTSPQTVFSRNSLVTQHPPQSLPVYTNIPMNTRMNNHNDTSNCRLSRYETFKPDESLSYHDQHLTIEEDRKYSNLSVHNDHETTDSSHSYANLDTVYPKRLYSQPSNNNLEIDDNSSVGYATIKEVK